MTISVGDVLPKANLMRIGAEGPEPVALENLTAGRKTIIVAVPGAFTPTCHAKHIPDFVEKADALRTAGVDHIIFLSVNDPWVMQYWGKATGAEDAGILMLADAAADFTRAIGMAFTAEGVGFINRSRRYAMLVNDGKVTALNLQDQGGDWAVTDADGMLAALG